MPFYRKRNYNRASRKVTLFLSPRFLPPANGVYTTSFGEVRVRNVYRTVEGKWIVNVWLPEGSFKFKDHVPNPPSPSEPSQDPDPSQTAS